MKTNEQTYATRIGGHELVVEYAGQVGQAYRGFFCSIGDTDAADLDEFLATHELDHFASFDVIKIDGRDYDADNDEQVAALDEISEIVSKGYEARATSGLDGDIVLSDKYLPEMTSWGAFESGDALVHHGERYGLNDDWSQVRNLRAEIERDCEYERGRDREDGAEYGYE